MLWRGFEHYIRLVFGDGEESARSKGETLCPHPGSEERGLVEVRLLAHQASERPGGGLLLEVWVGKIPQACEHDEQRQHPGGNREQWRLAPALRPPPRHDSQSQRREQRQDVSRQLGAA